VQVHINLDALNDVYDDVVIYDTHEIINALHNCEKKVTQLKYVTSRRKEKNAAYSGLVKSLSNISVEHGACSDL
jgi:hypothetical protein